MYLTDEYRDFFDILCVILVEYFEYIYINISVISLRPNIDISIH